MKTKTLHESASYHVTGEAVYIDDIEIKGMLNGYIYTSPFAHANILETSLDEARKVPGIHAIIDFLDIPGENQMGPIEHDEPVLAEKTVQFIGQAIFLIAAENEEAALEAKRKIKIEFEELEPVLTLRKSIEKNLLLQPERKIETGDVAKALSVAENILEGEIEMGGQEHWYLETQNCICISGEGNEMKVLSGTQHPAETQAIVAEVLDRSKHEIEVEVRRIGGAFGGKETQGNHIAAWTAILANSTKRTVKIRLERDEDQIITGKRHPFLIKYRVGFTNDGKLTALDTVLHANGGHATDLSMSILERSMMHIDNCYFIENVKIIGKAHRTNLPSNTAFRGFGGPQGMVAIETIVDKIARKLKKDAADIRELNFYDNEQRNQTPYGQRVENNRIQTIWSELLQTSNYRQKREDVNIFNSKSSYVKRGLSITPIKFGISFTTAFLNQAGALVNVYTDGSILVNHGGVEMGQGLHTKIQKIAALEFGVPTNTVKVSATNTAKVPNTSPTAASSATDLNGMAVKNACEIIKQRISETVAKRFSSEYDINVEKTDIVFDSNKVFASKFPEIIVSFKTAVADTYFSRKSLSSTGFYRTPGVYFNRVTGKGHPYLYYAFGAAVTEVEVDTLTGHKRIIKTDILHDAGKSIAENIDIGQIEGGFVQGYGWLTSEEMKYDKKGNLLNHAPDTYKIPGINDIPEEFNVNLLQNVPNPQTIRQSKAVGEPPFMLAISGWLAIKDAISSVNSHNTEPHFTAPATNEVIVLSAADLRNK